MLRMRPTQIELNARDYQWHNVRHENRQRQRARGSPVEAAITTPPQYTSYRTHEESTPQYRFSSSPVSEDSGIIAAPQMPLFSKKPDLHRFWSGVVAGAGLLPEVRSVHVAKPVVIAEPSDLISGLSSSRGSIEETRNDSQDLDKEASSHDENVTVSFRSKEEGRIDYYGGCSVPRRPITSTDIPRGNQTSNYQDDSSASMPQHSLHRRRRLSLFALHHHGYTGEEAPSLYRRDSDLRNLDGPSDLLATMDGLPPAFAASTTQPNFSHGSTLEDCIRVPRAMIAGGLSDYERTVQWAEPVRIAAPSEYATELSLSTSARSQLQVNPFRQRSSVHPRSPLYISQIATSSSPETRSRPSSYISDHDMSNQMEMLSIKPHRHNCYTAMESPHDGFQHGVDTSVEAPISMAHGSTALVPEMSYTHLSPQIVQSGSQYSINVSPSGSSSVSTNSHGRLSPVHTQEPVTPRYLSRHHPSLTVPPYPFSAVRRAVSFTPALPSASPSPLPPLDSTALYSNSTSLSPSLTPSPRTPSYAVYNDHLPASSQPQTPAGLSTNGLHRSGLPSIYRGAFTAPAGMARSARQQQSRNLYSSESPTRNRGRAMQWRMGDQENERHGLEAELRWRRQASSRGFGATENEDSDGDFTEAR